MRSGPGTDAELVARARAGEVEAFDHLVMRHRGRLYDLARHATGQPEAAQDIVQEALVRAFRSLGSLREGERFGQWLNTIVRRQSIQWHRDGRRTPEPTEPTALYSLVGAGAAPAEPPAEVVALVREALGALSQRHRQVMILHYLEGFTCEEIAGKLGVSAGRVKRILYDSRRKARAEQRTMADAQKKKGPRMLAKWMSGEVPHGEWDAPARIDTALGHSVCLSVNKRAKTVKEIAAEVDAHERYVEDKVTELADLEVLVSPRKGRYLLNFIAFDAEDWRKLAARMGEPAGEIAQRLADSQDTLRAAYEQTPLAVEWSWEDVVWVVNCQIIVNRGIQRFLGQYQTLKPPARPGGFPYWLGGYEHDLDVSRIDAPGWYGTDRGGGGVGHFGPSMQHKGYDWIFGPAPRGRDVLFALLEAPLPEEKILAQFGEHEREEYRSTLAELVSKGLVERADGGDYRLTFPIWREGDSEVLAPVVEEVIRPLAEEVLLPTWPDLDALLDEMGYEQRRDQYAVWRDWLCAFITGKALQFMVKQGTLPELGDSPPAKWNHAAWKGDLALMKLIAPEGNG